MREVIGHLLATARRDDVGGVDRRIGEAFDMRLLARNIVGVAVQRGAAMRAEEVSSQYVRVLVILRAEGLPNRIRVAGGDMIGFDERVASDLPVDRKSVVQGRSVAVRVGLGGRLLNQEHKWTQ